MGGYLKSLKGAKREKGTRFVAAARRLMGQFNPASPADGIESLRLAA